MTDRQDAAPRFELPVRFTLGGTGMALLYKRWDEPRCIFGDMVVLGFVLMQCLDGVFTYLGVSLWGPAIEANPLIASAIAAVGGSLGLGGAQVLPGFLAIHPVPSPRPTPPADPTPPRLSAVY